MKKLKIHNVDLFLSQSRLSQAYDYQSILGQVIFFKSEVPNPLVVARYWAAQAAGVCTCAAPLACVHAPAARAEPSPHPHPPAGLPSQKVCDGFINVALSAVFPNVQL